MFKNILISVLILFSLFSCNNEVDLNDEYQEITIVYGLLNPFENRHYVKVTKAFQSDGNIYIASKDASNSNFNEPREVWLDEYIDGNYIRTISLDTLTIENKEEGDFYYPTQLIYATQPNVMLIQNAEYQLFVKNTTTGKVVKSKTNTISDVYLTKPSGSQLTANFDYGTQSIKWTSSAQGKLYEINIRFFYHQDSLSNLKSGYIDKYVGSYRSKDVSGGELCFLELKNSSFFENISNNLKIASPEVKRYFDSLQYIVNVANEDFTVYMDLNKPSTSLVQERPSYTNIENGIGLFAARSNKIKTLYKLSQKSGDSLVMGSYTGKLGFQKIL